MNAVYPFQKSPRCTATSKRMRERCKAPAVNGWTVCRFHGDHVSLDRCTLCRCRLSATTTPEQRCEAQFYLGKWQLLRNNGSDARSTLQAAVDTCPKTPAATFALPPGSLNEVGQTLRALSARVTAKPS